MKITEEERDWVLSNRKQSFDDDYNDVDNWLLEAEGADAPPRATSFDDEYSAIKAAETHAGRSLAWSYQDGGDTAVAIDGDVTYYVWHR